MSCPTRVLSIVALAASIVQIADSVARAEFIHPGITHSQVSIDFVKAKIDSGEEPWATAWKNVQASRYANLDWRPQPRDNGPARASGKSELKLSYDTATGAGWGIAASKGIRGGRRGYKASLFEGGVGVPFIAHWPGKIAAGKVDDRSLMSAVDLLPTFCEIAGADLPDGYTPDGVSQVGTLKGRPAPVREKPLFWKYPSRWPAPKNRPDHWVTYAVVHKSWKLVSNRDGSQVELHDIARSPYERKDLKASKLQVVAALQKQLEEWKATLPEKPTGDVFSNERKTLSQ